MNLNSIITEIKENVNLLDYINSRGIDTKRVGKTHVCLCPAHSENSPSLTIYPESNTFHCFGCDWHGDIIDFHKHLENLDTIKAVKDLINLYGLNCSLDESSPKNQPRRIAKKAKPPQKPLLSLPHCNLAKLPQEKRGKEDPPVLSKELRSPNKAEKEAGGRMVYSHFYPYHAPNSEVEVFKRKTELLDALGKRIPFPDGKNKHFEWTSCKDKKFRKGKGGYKGTCYRFHQSQNCENKIIIVCEGEKDVELLRWHGLIAISFDSSNFSELSQIKCDGIIHLLDNDEAGMKKGATLQEFCRKSELPYLSIPITEIWEEAPEKSDISDYAVRFNNPAELGRHLELKIEAIWRKKALTEQLQTKTEQITANQQLEARDAKIKALKEQINATKAKMSQGEEISDKESSTVIEGMYELKKTERTSQPDELYTDSCLKELYSEGNYIFYESHLYKFNGKYYEKQSKVAEEKRIVEWLRGYNSKLAFDGPVNSVWKWLEKCLSVEYDQINPKGLNLANGTLTIKWDGKKPVIKLRKHNPKDIYLYCSNVAYDPNADPAKCDQLLQALDPPQQKILLRTLAAGLDKPTYDKHQENPRALIMYGNGGNGKDGIRKAVELLLGNGMVDVTLNDFQQYDHGKKESLQELLGAKIVWSSENTSLSKLESIGSIRSAITGQLIKIKYLYKDLIPYTPSCICLFHCNEIPAFTSSMNAVLRRWAVLRFTKTYKSKPNPLLGELLADPKFVKDSHFVANKVAPALLNKILAELPTLLTEGIDYDPVMADFEAMQQESNHLYEFCNQLGIEYVKEGKIYIHELWNELKQYYIDTGTLEIETNDKGKEKLTWHDQPKKGDNNVKGANQVYKRFSEIFPRLEKKRETERGDNHGKFYLSGIAKTASPPSPPTDTRDSAIPPHESGEAVVKLQTQTAVGGVDGEANFTTLLSEKSFDERVEILHSLFSASELETLGISPKNSDNEEITEDTSSTSPIRSKDEVTPVVKNNKQPTARYPSSIASLDLGDYINDRMTGMQGYVTEIDEESQRITYQAIGRETGIDAGKFIRHFELLQIVQKVPYKEGERVIYSEIPATVTKWLKYDHEQGYYFKIKLDHSEGRGKPKTKAVFAHSLTKAGGSEWILEPN